MSNIIETLQDAIHEPHALGITAIYLPPGEYERAKAMHVERVGYDSPLIQFSGARVQKHSRLPANRALIHYDDDSIKIVELDRGETYRLAAPSPELRKHLGADQLIDTAVGALEYASQIVEWMKTKEPDAA